MFLVLVMASSAALADSAGPSIGDLCFVCLIDTSRRSVDCECLILEIVDSEAFFAILGTAAQAFSGEWGEATASSEEQQPMEGQELAVSGCLPSCSGEVR